MLASSRWIYTNKVVLLGIERGDELAICLSSFFRLWLEKYSGGRLRGWLTISISDSIGTFPPPEKIISAEGIQAARSFNDHAVDWARTNGVGLTDVFAAIHDKSRLDPEIASFRLSLKKIDEAVAQAFEFSGLDMEYEFAEYESALAHERARFQLRESTQAEILERLLQLNKLRFAEQSRPTVRRRTRGEPAPVEGLFAQDTETPEVTDG